MIDFMLPVESALLKIMSGWLGTTYTTIAVGHAVQGEKERKTKKWDPGDLLKKHLLSNAPPTVEA